MLFTLEMSTLFGLPITYQDKIKRHKLMIEVIYIPTIVDKATKSQMTVF